MSESHSSAPALPRLPGVLRVLHWVIIVNFVINVLYGAYQVFFVITPASGQVGPLFGAAQTMPHELIMLRRAYATEVWISIVGVCLYVAITEILPRLLRRP